MIRVMNKIKYYDKKNNTYTYYMKHRKIISNKEKSHKKKVL
jgi:catabolite regulation protein CreA